MIDENPLRCGSKPFGRRLMSERGDCTWPRRRTASAMAAAGRAPGVARRTIGRGRKDLRDPTPVRGRVRRPGAGLREFTGKAPTLLTDLETLLERARMADPMRPLRWVSKSHDKLATALCAMGHKVSASSLPK